MITARTRRKGCIARVMLLTIIFTVACQTKTLAAPPVNALPAPLFCFDANSPSVRSGALKPADILTLGDTTPEVAVYGWQLGLCDLADQLGSVSSSHSGVSPSATFVILFSVDRNTVGVADPDPNLVQAGVPYNVKDQAWRGQAAGDQFVSTLRFTLTGPLRTGRLEPHDGQLGRNHFDEGGTDFQAVPMSSASAAPATLEQDNVIGTAYAASRTGQVEDVYFCVVSGSPSLDDLSGIGTVPSGAHIFYNAAPQSGGVTTMYAPYWALGLKAADNIDALMVFDENGNGNYDPGDSVLFSLAPGSPSLGQGGIPGASLAAGPADVFLARLGHDACVYAHAQDFGMGVVGDNIDALELVVVDSSFRLENVCIRALRGDLNCDDVIDTYDIDPFVMALVAPAEYYEIFPGGDLVRGDANHDGVVNTADIDPFVYILTRKSK